MSTLSFRRSLATLEKKCKTQFNMAPLYTLLLLYVGLLTTRATEVEPCAIARAINTWAEAAMQALKQQSPQTTKRARVKINLQVYTDTCRYLSW